MPHKDKAKRNAYHRAYREANKKEINDRLVAINRRRHERYARIVELKSKPCTDCAGTFPSYVMDFDHRDPSTKTMDVSSLVKRMVAWETVLAEITLCDLVCVRCHRIRTYRGDSNFRTIRYKHHILVLNRVKSENPCFDCDRFFVPCQMDFDHVGINNKTDDIARLVASTSDVLAAEIAKCHLVCANCHRIRSHNKQRPHAPEHSRALVSHFWACLDAIERPKDARFNTFPFPDLLGTVADKKLAIMTGFSREMVAWHRRQSGIKLTRNGRRTAE